MGPQGTGAICVRPGVSVEPLKVGGSGVLTFQREHPQDMPETLEAGTLNSHGIAGLGAAIRLDYRNWNRTDPKKRAAADVAFL